MPKYHIIVTDNQVYDFNMVIPDGVTDEERDQLILEHLSDYRDVCWRSGEETIEAIDKLP